MVAQARDWLRRGRRRPRGGVDDVRRHPDQPAQDRPAPTGSSVTAARMVMLGAAVGAMLSRQWHAAATTCPRLTRPRSRARTVWEMMETSISCKALPTTWEPTCVSASPESSSTRTHPRQGSWSSTASLRVGGHGLRRRRRDLQLRALHRGADSAETRSTSTRDR